MTLWSQVSLSSNSGRREQRRWPEVQMPRSFRQAEHNKKDTRTKNQTKKNNKKKGTRRATANRTRPSASCSARGCPRTMSAMSSSRLKATCAGMPSMRRKPTPKQKDCTTLGEAQRMIDARDASKAVRIGSELQVTNDGPAHSVGKQWAQAAADGQRQWVVDSGSCVNIIGASEVRNDDCREDPTCWNTAN